MTVKRYGTGLNGRIEEMECGAFTGYAEYSALLKERDALAVENESLKAYRPQPGGMAMMEALDAFEAQDDYPEGGMMDAFEILCCKRVPTPVTDAAIAKIQAQGVDRLAEHLSGLNIMASETSVREFAAQLRKESNHD